MYVRTCICVYVWHVLCLRQSGQAPTIHSRGLRHASATGRTRHPPRHNGVCVCVCVCVDPYSWLRLWVSGRVKVRVRLGLRLGLGHQPYECDLFSVCMCVCGCVVCGLWYITTHHGHTGSRYPLNPTPCCTHHLPGHFNPTQSPLHSIVCIEAVSECGSSVMFPDFCLLHRPEPERR